MHQKFLVLLLLNLSLTATGQFTYGIKAGFTNSTIKVTEGFSAADYKSKSGIQVGVTSSAILSDKFSLLSGLLYTQKGYRETYGAPGALGYSTYSRTINYLEVPVDLVFTTRAIKQLRAFVGTGLVAAFGLTDKTNYAIDYSGRPSDAGTAHFGFGKDKYYKSFGLGWNIIGGLGYKKLALGADYNIGLTAINHGGFNQTILKNKALAVTLTYYFLKNTALSKH